MPVLRNCFTNGFDSELALVTGFHIESNRACFVGFFPEQYLLQIGQGCRADVRDEILTQAALVLGDETLVVITHENPVTDDAVLFRSRIMLSAP